MNKGAAKSMEEEQTQKDSYNRPNKTRSFIDPLFLSNLTPKVSCTNSKSLWWINPSPTNITILNKYLYICNVCKNNNPMYVLPCIINFIHYGSVITVIFTVTFPPPFFIYVHCGEK